MEVKIFRWAIVFVILAGLSLGSLGRVFGADTMVVGNEFKAPTFYNPYGIETIDYCEGDMSNCISFDGVRKLMGYQVSATVKQDNIEALGWLQCGNGTPWPHVLWRAEQFKGTQAYVVMFPRSIQLVAPCWISRAILTMDPRLDNKIVYEVQAVLFFE